MEIGELERVSVFLFLLLRDQEGIWEDYFYNWPSTENKGNSADSSLR